MTEQISPPADAPLDGTKYRLIAPLGRGGMGQVWLAEHVALGAEVVVKVLNPEFFGRRDLSDRLRLEAQALGQLRHPNVVSVIDAGTTVTEQTFLVMERLHGRTLAAEFAVHRIFSAEDALSLAGQALSGLVAAHAAGIVHRDIKPSNLFLCEAPEPGAKEILKLIDFGIAKVMSDRPEAARLRPLAFPTEEGEVLGTPTALSPEQALARPVDHRTDVYAVGLLLYRILTGGHPFARFHGADLVRAYATSVPKPPSTTASIRVRPEIDALVMKALRTDPNERFGSAAEFLRELRRVESLPAEQRRETDTAVQAPSWETAAESFERALEPSLAAVSSPAPAIQTQRISTREVAALNAVLAPTERVVKRVATESLPATRTAGVPEIVGSRRRSSIGNKGRFVAVAGATALCVAAVLALLLWR